jgi:hypothetical protein
MVKNLLIHTFALIIMLVLAIGAVRLLGASTDLIRDVPLLYALYISIVVIVYFVRKNKANPKRGHD